MSEIIDFVKDEGFAIKSSQGPYLTAQYDLTLDITEARMFETSDDAMTVRNLAVEGGSLGGDSKIVKVTSLVYVEEDL